MTRRSSSRRAMLAMACAATLVVGLLGFGAGREFERVNVDRLRRLLPG